MEFRLSAVYGMDLKVEVDSALLIDGKGKLQGRLEDDFIIELPDMY